MLGCQKFETASFRGDIVTGKQPRAAGQRGFCGEMFMLRAVELGLGGCWVTGTYKRSQVGLKVREGEKLVAMMPLGNPKTPPQPPLSRKRKDVAEFCPEYDSLCPVFKEIVQLVRVAPSAMNLQPVRFKLLNPSTITLTVGSAMHRLDLGIAICHAMLALGSTPALFSLEDSGLTATLELL